MRMRSRIGVAKEHIETCKQKDAHRCMIADAIREAIPKARRILVDTQTIRFSLDDVRLRFTYLTPPAAQAAIIRFDKGDRTIRPFEFTLGPPVRVRPVNPNPAKARRPPQTKAHRAKYAFLAANRARNHMDRQYGIRALNLNS